MNASNSADYELGQVVAVVVSAVFFGIVSRLLAKEKGRNVLAWTILGCIPVVNVFCMMFFVGAANLRQERKLDALLKAQGHDPARLAR